MRTALGFTKCTRRSPSMAAIFSADKYISNLIYQQQLVQSVQIVGPNRSNFTKRFEPLELFERFDRPFLVTE
jgi:hypothetical protein